MTKQKTFSRWWLGLAAVFIVGLALWYFRSQPIAPQAAPLAQTPPAAPLTSALEQSPAQLAAVPAPAEGRPEQATQERVERAASPAATPQVAPSLAQIPPGYEGPPLPVIPEPIPHDAIERPTAVAATARMYAAHAPLRTPEVSDPDSAANKQILQTMVLKALAQPASPPLVLSPSNGPASQQVTSAE